ncbi:hypothetical protein QQ045_013458 [Rhodiola kirilowii]
MGHRQSICHPRITFEVSVCLLGGLMALGYSIATILKRSSQVFSEEKVCVKIDWLEQLNRQYIQIAALTRGQRKIMHQVDNLSSLLRECLESKSQRTRTGHKVMIPGLGAIRLPIILTVTIGGFGIILLKGFVARN